MESTPIRDLSSSFCVHFIINVKKSDLHPSQELVYIGGLLSPRQGQVFLPVDRREALARAIVSFSCVGALHSVRAWMQIMGLMAATIYCIPHARLRMRPIQWHVKDRWNGTSFETLVMVTSQVREALMWWSMMTNLSKGLSLQSPPHGFTVTTDASMEGCGGHCLIGDDHLLYSGRWSQPERQSCHINVLELRAVRLILQNIQSIKNQFTVIE